MVTWRSEHTIKTYLPVSLALITLSVLRPRPSLTDALTVRHDSSCASVRRCYMCLVLGEEYSYEPLALPGRNPLSLLPCLDPC